MQLSNVQSFRHRFAPQPPGIHPLWQLLSRPHPCLRTTIIAGFIRPLRPTQFRDTPVALPRHPLTILRLSSKAARNKRKQPSARHRLGAMRIPHPSPPPKRGRRRTFACDLVFLEGIPDACLRRGAGARPVPSRRCAYNWWEQTVNAGRSTCILPASEGTRGTWPASL